MTRIVAIKPSVWPFVWTNALDERGVVHRVVSLSGVMHLCTARCGLDGRWDHARNDSRATPVDVLTWTDETPSCMTCIVREAERATA